MKHKQAEFDVHGTKYICDYVGIGKQDEQPQHCFRLPNGNKLYLTDKEMENVQWYTQQKQ